jgi:hypothetical protein
MAFNSQLALTRANKIFLAIIPFKNYKISLTFLDGTAKMETCYYEAPPMEACFFADNIGFIFGQMSAPESLFGAVNDHSSTGTNH